MNSLNQPKICRISTISVGIVILLYAVLKLSVTIYVVNSLWQLAKGYVQSMANPTEFELSIWKLIWNHHNDFILGFLALIGASTFLGRKKIGWSIALAISVYTVYSFIIIYIRTDVADPAIVFYGYIALAIAALFLLMLVLLILKPMRKYFKIGENQWGLTAILVGLLLVDQLFL